MLYIYTERERERERERESIIHIAYTGRGGEPECGLRVGGCYTYITGLCGGSEYICITGLCVCWCIHTCY